MNATSIYLKAASGLFALAMSLGISQAISTGMERSANDQRIAAAAQKHTQVAQNQNTTTAVERN